MGIPLLSSQEHYPTMLVNLFNLLFYSLTGFEVGERALQLVPRGQWLTPTTREPSAEIKPSNDKLMQS